MKIFALLLSLFTTPLPAAASNQADLNYFSPDFSAARTRFLRDSQALAEGEVGGFAVPSRRDGDLSVDYIYLPPRGQTKNLVVLVSGVHGMEGFAGSAIQSMFLREFGPGLEREDTGYLVVHALNPYGFKYFRRATENNVNLNRNFSTRPELFTTANPKYLDLAEILEPTGTLWHSDLGSAATALGIAWNLATGFSISDLNEAIGQGQYTNPRGLEFGGQQLEPQTRKFIDLLARTSRPYRNVVLLDLHTGLGEAYHLHLMPGDAPGAVDQDLFAALFRPKEDSLTYDYTPVETDGFYHTHGDLTNLLPELLAPHQRAVGLTMEFGTVGNGPLAKLQTLSRLVLENQGFHYGFANRFVEANVRENFAELFFPSEETWRLNVIAKARQTFRLSLARLKLLP